MMADDVCVTVPQASPADLPRRCDWKIRQNASTRDGVYVLPLPTGGDHFVLFKAEIRLPLTSQLLFTLFTDAGNLWLSRVRWDDMRLRVNPGAGLRYATPAGPIGLDVGFNLDPDPFRSERSVNWQFAVGVF